MDNLELTQEKADLRKAMKPIRSRAKQENPQAESALNEQLNAVFGTYEAQKQAHEGPKSDEETLIIGGYAPIQSEFPVWQIMKSLAEAGNQLCLPLVIGPNRPLSFLSWGPEEPLIEGAFGAKTPDPDKAVALTPNVLLVPLLAFDEKGYRLGYGGGFYDRSIALYKPQLTIGIAFEAQRVKSVPIGSYDLALSCIMTENGLAVSNLN